MVLDLTPEAPVAGEKDGPKIAQAKREAEILLKWFIQETQEWILRVSKPDVSGVWARGYLLEVPAGACPPTLVQYVLPVWQDIVLEGENYEVSSEEPRTREEMPGLLQ